MKLLTPQQVSEKSGLSVETIRAACYRTVNPLPHVDVGTKRRRYPRIRWEQFEKWLGEEEARIYVR